MAVGGLQWGPGVWGESGEPQGSGSGTVRAGGALRKRQSSLKCDFRSRVEFSRWVAAANGQFPILFFSPDIKHLWND